MLDNNKGFINLRFLQKMNWQKTEDGRRSGTRLDSLAWYNSLLYTMTLAVPPLKKIIFLPLLP